MKKLKNKNFINYIIILLFSLVMCIPLFQSGIHTGHDGDFHISRTIGTLEQLSNGNSPFIVSRFSNNLGFAWNLFYPPVSTLINVFFAFLTGNVVTAMKIFIFITFLCSGFSMYKLVKTITNNNLASLIASIFYMIAPYRLLNAYTRLAVGEMVSFIFIPIIFRGVYYLLNDETKKSYLYVLGTIGLVLSHNISTLLTFILGFIYVLINIKKLKDKTILKNFCISTLVIILSVLFFEVPLLEQKSSVELEVFKYGKMYSNMSVMGHALNPLQLLFKNSPGADSSMYFCIGIPILFGLLLTPFTYKQNKNNKNYKYFLIIGIVATIMSTFIFPWFIMPDILLMIQFPWRMLVVVILSFSIISGINISNFIDFLILKIKEKKNIKKSNFEFKFNCFAFSIITILSCLYSLTFVQNLDMKIADNAFYEEPEIIDPKNQVSRYSSFLEYWPQKAINSIDYIIERDNKVKLLSGNCTIENETKTNGILDFDINNISDNTTLELPYLFYKGYVVTYTPTNTNEKIILNVSESDKGLVQLSVDSSINGHINVEYHATKLHKVCIVISLLTILIYVSIIIFKNCNKNKMFYLKDSN